MAGLKVTRVAPYGAVLPASLSIDATYTGDDADWPSSPSGDFGPDTSLVTVAASGVTETIDVSVARTYDVTLTADCVFTFTGAQDDEAWYFSLILRQDGTGGWTSTWPGSVVWPGGSAPALDETASTVEVLTFFSLDGGTVWFGFEAGGGSMVDALDDLSDVTITTPTTGDTLRYNGTAWVNTAGRWEVVVSGSAPPVAVSTPSDDDWVYAWITD